MPHEFRLIRLGLGIVLAQGLVRWGSHCTTAGLSPIEMGVQPVYVGDDDTRQRITLILLFDAKAGPPDKAHTGYHYITVTSLSALLRGDARNEEAHCTRCLYTFAGVGATERLEKHRPECRGINGGGVQRVTMPSAEDDNNIFEFSEFEYTLRAPFAIYLDFESSLVAVPDEHQPKSAQQSKRDGKTPNTERLQVHKTNSYNFITLGPDGKSYLDGDYDSFYRGPEAAKHCLENISVVGDLIKDHLQDYRERPKLTPEQEASWRADEV